MELVRIKDDLFVPVDFSKNHAYFADAEGTKPYTGITSVLNILAKPALYGWYARMAIENVQREITRCFDTLGKFIDAEFQLVLEESKGAGNKKKEDAGVHGTDAHALVEGYVKACIEVFDGKPVQRNPDTADQIAPFVKWAFENVDHFLFSERRMSDRTLFLAGTADFACVMKDGKKLMGDFKTSSGIYGIDYWLQVAAYRFLAESEGDAPYDGSVIVRLGKKGPEDFEVQYRYDYATDKEAFMACLTIYRAQATYVKPTNNKKYVRKAHSK